MPIAQAQPLVRIFNPEESELVSTPFSWSDATRVLVADDDSVMLDTIREVLARHGFEAHLAQNASDALEKLQNERFALILADQRMPQMTGLELLAQAKVLQPNTTRILVTGVADSTTLIEAINKGEIYRFVSKPWETEEFLVAVKNGVQRYELVCRNQELRETTQAMNEQLASLSRCLEEKVKMETIHNHHLTELNRALSRNFQLSVQMCFQTLSTYHPTLGAQTRKTVDLCRLMATELRLSEDQNQVLEISAWLHDIGLMGLPSDLILRWQYQPQKVTTDERQLVEHHPVLGQEMAAFVYKMADVGKVIRAHHERMDGTGFPDGLAGEDIPWLARLLSVAAAAAAHTTTRERSSSSSGTEDPGAFDPEALRVLTRCLNHVDTPRPVKTVPLADLQPGMVLAKDVATPQGRLLLPAGSALCETWISHLRKFGRVYPIGSDLSVYE